ncbi:ABC transporter permease subunit [Actinomadura sp. LD22]|uniref:ABC transporter permease subunit n=1 Tax=Actinomadura physcomitrii TaxID=2650748 RepID=A0A6I4MD43_9ACTN|nr:ABC transporter permease [Actinomadura physcomitrii]MWA03623.1 ABC transporter permease subunit [Actinomadura physcomitrii]
MGRLIAKRIGIGVLVLWGAVTLMFLLVRVAPGDPATVLVGATATHEQLAAVRQSMGLNDPLFVQYWHYLGDAARLDFGDSTTLSQPAMTAVLHETAATLQLILAATVLALVVGLPLGAYAGQRPGRFRDRLISAATLGLQAIPNFWVGIMFILLFAGTWGLLPSSGAGGIDHLVLPAVSLAMPFTAIVARLTRSAVAASTAEAYVRTARSKGIPERRVLFGHILGNSLLPVVTVVGLQIGALIGGDVVVENVYSWPGIGSLLVTAVNNRDYNVVQAAALLIAGIVVVLNLCVDLLYLRLDPRIRTGGRA